MAGEFVGAFLSFRPAILPAQSRKTPTSMTPAKTNHPRFLIVEILRSERSGLQWKYSLQWLGMISCNWKCAFGVW